MVMSFGLIKTGQKYIYFILVCIVIGLRCINKRWIVQYFAKN